MRYGPGWGSRRSPDQLPDALSKNLPRKLLSASGSFSLTELLFFYSFRSLLFIYEIFFTVTSLFIPCGFVNPFFLTKKTSRFPGRPFRYSKKLCLSSCLGACCLGCCFCSCLSCFLSSCLGCLLSSCLSCCSSSCLSCCSGSCFSSCSGSCLGSFLSLFCFASCNLLP